MLFKQHLLFIAILLSITHSASAASNMQKLYLGAGGSVYNSNRVAKSNDGTPSLTSTAYVSFALTGRIPLGQQWQLAPSFSYTPLGHKDTDGEKTTLMGLTLPLARMINDVDLRLGPGFLFYTVSGPGGTTTLPNGTSTMSFYLPSSSSTTILMLADLGVGVALDRIRFDFDTWVTGAVSSKRAVSAVATISYGLF